MDRHGTVRDHIARAREGAVAAGRAGVTIHAPLNLPATLPAHASQMLARNVTAILKPMLVEGSVEVDLEDEVVAACAVTHAGEVRFGG